MHSKPIWSSVWVKLDTMTMRSVPRERISQSSRSNTACTVTYTPGINTPHQHTRQITTNATTSTTASTHPHPHQRPQPRTRGRSASCRWQLLLCVVFGVFFGGRGVHCDTTLTILPESSDMMPPVPVGCCTLDPRELFRPPPNPHWLSPRMSKFSGKRCAQSLNVSANWLPVSAFLPRRPPPPPPPAPEG